jgi:hypothetical protein
VATDPGGNAGSQGPALDHAVHVGLGQRQPDPNVIGPCLRAYSRPAPAPSIN